MNSKNSVLHTKARPVAECIKYPDTINTGLTLHNNQLTTLVGLPRKINGSFLANDGTIISLVGGPVYVGGSYHVSRNRLTSLEGCPDIINGSLGISENPGITSLIGGPSIVNGNFFARECSLTSLVGGPEIVKGDFIVHDNKLVSFDGIPITIHGSVYAQSNPLKTLQLSRLKEMEGSFMLYDCQIESHILGVFFIKGCEGINTSSGGAFGKAAKIVNFHIEKGRAGLLPCQRALIEAGLHDFAQI
jgi:hypothetical protein